MSQDVHSPAPGADDVARAAGTVIVAVDASPQARCALLLAAGVARFRNAELVIAHLPSCGTLNVFGAAFGAGEQLRTAQEVMVADLVDELRPLLELEGVRWRFVVLEGPLCAALTELAERTNATAVVVGAPQTSLRARLYHVVVPTVPRLLLRRRHRFTLLVA